MTAVAEQAPERRPERRRSGIAALLGRSGSLAAAWTILALLIAILAALRPGVFTLDELNIDAAAAMTLVLVASGQTIVLLRGGIDLSVGGILSLSTVLAATQFGEGAGSVILWSVLILAGGAAIGAVNGLLISVLQLQPFLVTLATWSIVGGTALIVLPSEGGGVPGFWMRAGFDTWLGLSLAVWLLALLMLWWAWFRRTRLLTSIRAAGSNERSAFLCGVSLLRSNVAAYAFSGLFAALAGLFLSTQTASGSPIVGNQFVLPSVAAAVIGGTSLFGGRGGLVGTAVGAVILTLIANVVFVLHISSFWQPVVSGVILLLAVLATAVTESSIARRGEPE